MTDLTGRINKALGLGVDDAARVLASAKKISLADARKAIRASVVLADG